MPGQRASARQRNALPSVPGLLIPVLIALKLAGVIAWPWWEVLLPVWFGLGALFLAGSYALTVTITGGLANRRADRAERRALSPPPYFPHHNTPTPP